MSETLSVAIDTTKDVVRPTLEDEAARMDAGQQTGLDAPPADKDRPAWLNEKFKSPEELAKAYEELEKKLGTKSNETDETKSNEEQDETPAGDQTEARKVADEAVKKAGLDLGSLSQKFWQNGGIDDADYTALDKAGYPKDLVDQFINGQQAILSQRTQSVYETAGGAESYQEMIQWAGQNLPPKEIAAFNKTVNGSDMDAIMFAVRGLKAQYNGNVGFEPTHQVKGQTSSKTGAASYNSIAELERDMGDPRYSNDPAFRKNVEQKLGRSDIF